MGEDGLLARIFPRLAPSPSALVGPGGDTAVGANIGTIPAGASVTITFRATINDPLPIGVTQVANQGLVSGGNFPTVPTDDPSTPAQT